MPTMILPHLRRSPLRFQYIRNAISHPNRPRLTLLVTAGGRKLQGPLAVAALILAAACSDSPTGLQRDLTASVQTEQLSYVLRVFGEGVSAAVALTFQNRTGGDWVLENCEGFSVTLEKRTAGGQWSTVYSQTGNRLNCSDPDVVIPSDGDYRYMHQLTGLPGSNTVPIFDDESPAAFTASAFLDCCRPEPTNLWTLRCGSAIPSSSFASLGRRESDALAARWEHADGPRLANGTPAMRQSPDV